jgi:hypothetical protein
MKKLKFYTLIKLFVCLFVFLLLNTDLKAQFNGKTVLLVAATDSGNIAEKAIVLRLEDMGFNVTIKNQAIVNDTDAQHSDLVYISATVTSTTVSTNLPGLDTLAVPVMNCEPFLHDFLGFQAANGGQFNTNTIKIIKDDHPLAAKLSVGIDTISRVQKAVSYGTPQGNPIIIAVNPADSTQAVLFAYEKEDTMYTGTAPERRVGTFFFENVADTSMTIDGWRLFDASVYWAMKYTPIIDLQAYNVQFKNMTSTQIDISFTKGDGDYRVVFMSQGSTGKPSVADSITYTADTTFGLGTQAGTGWYCIANGNLSGNSITVTGLTTTNKYRVMVLEYIGGSGAEQYLTTANLGNPANTLKDDQTITFNALPVMTYGDADFALAATASSGLPVAYTSSNNSVATIFFGQIHIVGAGTSDITASQPGNVIYNAAPDSIQILTVNKALLTATADNYTRKTGESNPAFTITYSNWVGADSAAMLETQPTATCSATETSPAGDYDIIVSGGSDNNYTFNYVKGTLTIQPSTAIDNVADLRVDIYPVPSNDKLYIKLSGSAPARLQIINLKGQILLSRQLKNQFETIDVSEFEKGMYTIRIITNDNLIVKKIEVY